MNSYRTEARAHPGFVFYLPTEGNPALNLLATVFAFLRKAGALSDRYVITVPGLPDGSEAAQSITPEEILCILGRQEPRTFALRHDSGDLSQGIVLLACSKTVRYGCFTVANQIPNLRPPSWSPLIEELASVVRFAFAGTHNPDYIGWQRCADAKYYKQKYGAVHSSQITRPLPPPLDKFEQLDVSRNPGRFDHVNGGPAFVSSDMWLGPAFWDYAPCRRDEIVKQNWLNLQETEQFLHINAYPEPFTRPDGEQGEIQRRLWQLLFHLDCQWPPK
jgi:hypothetical protein